MPMARSSAQSGIRRWTSRAGAAAVVSVITVAIPLLHGQQPASAPGSGAAGPIADLILTNGKIVTVDERFTIAEGLAIRGDRIVAAGSSQDIARLAGPSTRRIDLRGRTVTPGLIVNHMHLLRAATTWDIELRWDGVYSR
jgi:hypothetical protein